MSLEGFRGLGKWDSQNVSPCCWFLQLLLMMLAPVAVRGMTKTKSPRLPVFFFQGPMLIMSALRSGWSRLWARFLVLLIHALTRSWTSIQRKDEQWLNHVPRACQYSSSEELAQVCLGSLTLVCWTCRDVQGALEGCTAPEGVTT